MSPSSAMAGACRAEEGLGTSLTPDPSGSPVTCEVARGSGAHAPLGPRPAECLCCVGVTGCGPGRPGQQGLVPQVF